MESLQIKGFRSIKDSGEIELKPITAVIGKNSCGKSSFIRFFPLLKQSTEKEISETLLWYGDYVDFGDYDSIKYNFSHDIDTSFTFKVKIPSKIYRYHYWGGYNSKLINAKINLVLAPKFISYFSINVQEQLIEIFLSDKNIVERILINNLEVDCSKYKWFRESRSLLPILTTSPNKSNDYYMMWNNDASLLNLETTLREIVASNTSNKSFMELMQQILVIQSKNELRTRLTRSKLGSVKNYFKDIEKSGSTLDKINTYIIQSLLTDLIREINRSLSNELNNIHYLKPIRASVNRFYRVQGLNIDHVDSDGSNLAMILYNLLDDEINEFENWTNTHFGIKFSVLDQSGHASLIIKDSDNNINLADTGYGYSQILPIIVELWLLLRKKETTKQCITIVIEQPELHLHPAFQAKIIDLFANIISQAKLRKIDIKLIFETHSETMINRLGELISENKLSELDVNILAFEKLDSETKVTHMNFNEEGLIVNWPVGFFSVED